MAENEEKVFSENEEMLVAFRALAVMMKQVVAEGDTALGALENLEPREKKALKQFQLAGEQCLGQLRGWTLQALDDVGKALKSTVLQKRASEYLHQGIASKVGKVGQSIYDMFQKYDSNGDGVLDLREFKQAFSEISKEEISDETMNKLMNAWDVNHDGSIDIHEFVVWLYGSDGESKEGQDVELLKAKLQEAEVELNLKRRIINQLESQHEEEMECTHDFWRSIAKHAVLSIDQKVNLENAEWLGNGKYGFVLKATRRSDKRLLVVKMMGVRWAHLAAQEWQSGSMITRHENIVEYEDVMLHADNDKSIQNLLKGGYESGALKSRTKRSTFPDRYICLTQELMNRGTVQDWLDSELLLPGGEFVIMQQVACALAYMHQNGVTHNDIKPENIMLHEESEGSPPKVKVGDLGCATKSKDVAARNNDFWQYGMTSFCIISGEKFGTRKYRAEDASSICDELAKIVKNSGCAGKVRSCYEDIPPLLLQVFPAEIPFKDVRDRTSLQGWGFYEGGGYDEAPPSPNPIAQARRRSQAANHKKIDQLLEVTHSRACDKVK